MANFRPLKRSILFCLQKLMARHDLQPDFLDIGCGLGDVSVFLAEQGWTGKAIDISDAALAAAGSNLEKFPGVCLAREDFFETDGKFGTVLMLDILEHLADDTAALGKMAALVRSGGHAVVVVPSNPKKWGWDDDYYGHIRRYTEEDIRAKLLNAGLNPVEVWDFTWPVFTALRGIYIRIIGKPAESLGQNSRSERTLRSGMVPQWQRFSLVEKLGRARFFWDLVYRIQFRFFRNRVRWGHEIIVLAKRTQPEAAYG